MVELRLRLDLPGPVQQRPEQLACLLGLDTDRKEVQRIAPGYGAQAQQVFLGPEHEGGLVRGEEPAHGRVRAARLPSCLDRHDDEPAVAHLEAQERVRERPDARTERREREPDPLHLGDAIARLGPPGLTAAVGEMAGVAEIVDMDRVADDAHQGDPIMPVLPGAVVGWLGAVPGDAERPGAYRDRGRYDGGRERG